MSDPVVTVLAHKSARGWPDYDTGRKAFTVPLSRALSKRWRQDHHFAGYPTPNKRRLNTGAIGRVSITIGALVLDLDCPKEQKVEGVAPDDWRRDLATRFHRLQQEHPGAFAYHTRGGSRIIYTIAPFSVDSEANARKWKVQYAVICAYLLDRYGLECDTACADWTRLYRLPHVVRDGKRERWPTTGDPEAIGRLHIKPESAHIELAKKLLPNAFPRPRPKPAERARRAARYSSFAREHASSRGPFYAVLESRGDIFASHRLGWTIRCPNGAQHSSGHDGDGSTILIQSGTESLGVIKCLHAHCAGLEVDDWIELLGGYREQGAA